MQKFDINKVICISLKSHNQQQLFSIAEYYKLSFPALVEMKNSGITKVICESGGDFVIAVVHSQDERKLVIKENFNPLTKKQYDSLNKVKAVKVPKISKTPDTLANYEFFLKEGYDIFTKSLERKNPLEDYEITEIKLEKKQKPQQIVESKKSNKVFTVDEILDKIIDKGMDSLTQEERDFLNSQR
jgi:hypothetical protein